VTHHASDPSSGVATQKDFGAGRFFRTFTQSHGLCTSFAKQFNAELLLFHAVPIMTAPAPMYSIPLETDASCVKNRASSLRNGGSALPAEALFKGNHRDGASAYARLSKPQLRTMSI